MRFAGGGRERRRHFTVAGCRRRVPGWQEGARDHQLVVCPGDVHPQSVLMRDGELVVIDWDNICPGPVSWDHAALLTCAERWAAPQATTTPSSPGTASTYEPRESPRPSLACSFSPPRSTRSSWGPSQTVTPLRHRCVWSTGGASRHHHPGPPSELSYCSAWTLGSAAKPFPPAPSGGRGRARVRASRSATSVLTIASATSRFFQRDFQRSFPRFHG